jgi:hypothetical protein
MNLPRDPDPAADQLGVPLNIIVSGGASPEPDASAADQNAPKRLHAKGYDSHNAPLRQQHIERWQRGLARHYHRQERAITSRVPVQISENGKADIGGIWWDDERWDNELAADLLRLNSLTANAWAENMIEQTGADIGDMDAFQARMLPWLSEHSHMQAAYINRRTQEALAEALRQPETLQAVKDLFALAATSWALLEAGSAVTSASNFGAHEAANAGGLRQKRWHVNSSNPRDSHAAVNGETVGIRELFSNGLRWPGDPRGSAEDNANCQCSVEFLRGD